MHDKVKIVIGLVTFLILVTFPFWVNMATGTDWGRPNKVIEEEIARLRADPGLPCALKQSEEERAAGAPNLAMVNQHMALLLEWRDEVVRDGDREVPKWWQDAAGKPRVVHGRTLKKSLTDGCLVCHTKKKPGEKKDKFCDVCHTYVEMDPYCWDCHVVP